MSEQNIIKSGRIEYIDAMRGFTMILVVICHVSGFCLNIDRTNTSFNSFFIEFRMPLFFFVSGFVLYKCNVLWNWSYTTNFLHKKFYVQIVSTFIFFLVHCSIFNHNIIDNLYNEYKDGYWFTFVLFEFFIIYCLTRLISSSLRLNSLWKDTFMLCIGVFFFVVTIPSVMTRLHIANEWSGIMSFNHWFLFLFFIIGTLVKKHFTRFLQLLERKTLLTACIVVFFGVNIFRDAIMATHINFFRLLTAITGIIIVFAFFWSHQSFFCNHNHIGRILCFIGRRTLDIYLLHYFLLPTNLSEVISVVHNHSMPVIELAISLTITIIVIAMCLLISQILRLSPLLGRLLFGVRA